jgi:hypothetical protein
MCTPQTWRPFSPLSKAQGSNSPTATRQASACEVSPAVSKKLSSKRLLVTPAGERSPAGVRSKSVAALQVKTADVSNPARSSLTGTQLIALEKPRLRRRRPMASSKASRQTLLHSGRRWIAPTIQTHLQVE